MLVTLLSGTRLYSGEGYKNHICVDTGVPILLSYAVSVRMFVPFLWGMCHQFLAHLWSSSDGKAFSFLELRSFLKCRSHR